MIDPVRSDLSQETQIANRMHELMLSKMAAHRGDKTYWLGADETILWEHFVAEVFVFLDMFQNPVDETGFTHDPFSIWLAAADVANYAAMIADLYESKHGR